MQHKNSPVIIDVRTKEEFESGHYPDAMNIPLDDIMKRIDEIKEMRSPVIAYCRTGNRSALAVAMLSCAGIREVINGKGLEDMFKRYPVGNLKRNI